MKASLLALLLPCTAAWASAQSIPEGQDTLPADTRKDSLLLPPISTPDLPVQPFGMFGFTPFGCLPSTAWQLHPGLNASVGMHVSVAAGKYAPRGAGFGQDATFLYALPVTDRLSVAAGIYAGNINWGFLHYRQAGFAALAAYRLNDRISIYAYGNKSFTPDNPLYGYPMQTWTPDRLGGMVNFKLGEKSSISIGIEGQKYAGPRWY